MNNGRYNIYTLIHKGLRASLFETLVELGRVDDSDRAAVDRQLDRVLALLELCQAHLEHENNFIHRTILAERPHVQLTTAEDHLEHEASIRRLRDDVAAVREVNPVQRSAMLLQLYRDLALFVAENLQHMHVEETLNSRILWEQFSDEQILAIEHELVASMTPQEQMDSLQLMLRHMAHSERMALLQALAQQMPTDLLKQVLLGLQLETAYLERLLRLLFDAPLNAGSDAA